jgi:hypothetical protein
MSRLTQALARVVDELAALGSDIALIGGLAVGERAQERFTRDIDLAVAVENDAQAERIVFELQRQGYSVLMLLEQEQTARLATVRLVPPGETAGGVVVDLLFASSGIEPEIVRAAERLEVFPGVILPVARVEALIALKVLARDDTRRPQDHIDLVSLVGVASAAQLEAAGNLLRLVQQRGFARGRQLENAFELLLAELRPHGA